MFSGVGEAGASTVGVRSRWILVIAVIVVFVFILRLAQVQIVWGPALSEKAQDQRTQVLTIPARRGTITDIHGQTLAHTMQARMLTTSPNTLRRDVGELHAQYPTVYPDVDSYIDALADDIATMVTEAAASPTTVKADEIRDKLYADTGYAVLVRNVDPDIAQEVADKYPTIAADQLDLRQYPNGAIGANVIGKLSAEEEGQFGYEAYADALLAGSDGRLTAETTKMGALLPGTERNRIPAVNGSDVQLTIDIDAQTFIQSQVDQAMADSGAKGVSAVVLDAHSAEVIAMAASNTIDPMGDIEAQVKQGKTFNNPTISAPLEPGSVAKIITAAAAIEDGKTTPDEVIDTPGSIDMAGITVHDAWPHGVVPFTTTGIFGKSSNVGTLMLAQRVGEDRFAEMLKLFGIGSPTHIELPGESQGLLPDRSQWTAGTFANLPIGQGMSLTLLQMASVYQTIANDGQRVEPRIVKKITNPDGTVVTQDKPPTTQVISPETARTLRTMFQAVTQRDPSGINQGTGPQASVDGYQIAGKTGTAQQIDPNCNCYSNSMYWITFAGIAPADNPRYVIAIEMDNPQRGPHGEGGQSAAPLFHDIAAWLLNRDNVPLSGPRDPAMLTLQMQ
ncbi:peptidoglycan D,D-transpeptidase FtsI family protein [Corynebacterium choanae]|uniref:peptidoglycan D,D-transpeptidase FtsI family protein n=1 Tax=Corynebacterium choanae TaxID=1862358 RepID=UPI00360A295D